LQFYAPYARRSVVLMVTAGAGVRLSRVPDNSASDAYTKCRIMASRPKSSWVRRRLEDALRRAFTKAYETIKVDPKHYLEHLRMAYNLPALTYDGVYSVN